MSNIIDRCTEPEAKRDRLRKALEKIVGMEAETHEPDLF